MSPTSLARNTLSETDNSGNNGCSDEITIPLTVGRVVHWWSTAVYLIKQYSQASPRLYYLGSLHKVHKVTCECDNSDHRDSVKYSLEDHLSLRICGILWGCCFNCVAAEPLHPIHPTLLTPDKVDSKITSQQIFCRQISISPYGCPD